MAQRDLDEAYNEILDLLRRHELSWVVGQVQDQVRAGKPATRMVTPRSAPVSDLFAGEVSQPRRQRRERLAATEPYSASERLRLALEAIERAVIQTVEVQREVVEFFDSEGIAGTGVAFEPEQFDETARFEIRALPQSRMDALTQLRSAINALRSEVAQHGDH
jgi:hypothetical protein